MGPSDYAENVGTEADPDEQPVEDDGCLGCGGKCDPGHVLCTLCIADKTRHVGDECAALVRDFMTASNRIAAVDDSGPATDLGLQATEAA